ncbi:MAG TPA: phage tail length tape measure family protein, partial [Burkholderiales bacterium]|nr:phage tail length tape measure family protein [Burkholderiales bacterium]
MTGESTSGSLGTARIDVTVNADTMAPGIAKARTAVAGMGTEAEAQYAKAAASSKKYADSLIRQADLIGKTRAEQIAYNAQTRIGGELGAQIAARALAQQNALTGAAGAAKALSSEINSISDAQLLKVNQAIAAFRQNAAAGRAAASAAAAENADRASADAYLAADREKIAANAGVIESNDAVAASAAARAAEEAAIQAESVAQLNAATLAKSAAYARLQLAMQGNLATESGIAEAEFAIDEAMAAGAITVREQAAYFVKLAAAENLATVETEANTAATLENAAAFKLSSRATTELGVVFGELASGNTGRLKYSLSALANQTGLLAKLMSPAGLAIIGVVGAIALFAKAAYEGEQETTAFNKALESTGGYAGVTTEELQSMAKAMSGTIGTQHEAAAALAEVAGTGKFTAGQIALVGKAAEEMSRLTGQSTAATIKQFESLQEKPLEAVLKLNDAQHFLTLSVY